MKDHKALRQPVNYRCLQCMAGLDADVSTNLIICDQCKTSFPIISKIPVFTSNAPSLLRWQYRSLLDTRRDLEKKRHNPFKSADVANTSYQRGRMSRMLFGTARNIKLVDSLTRPFLDLFSNEGRESLESTDWMLGNSAGSELRSMLPYFYQDWGQTPDFESARDLIVDALKSRADLDTVAVLGAGACGVANAAASIFNYTCAVDLSVPTLLLARRLLNGKSIKFSLEQAGWRALRLTNRKSATNPIGLVAADASKLPVGDETFSAVVTQYLLDVVRNPVLLISEIRRVLRPSGIWVNFSMPFKLPGDPPALARPGIPEMKGVLRRLGFKLIMGTEHRFSFLNLERLYKSAHRAEQNVHLLVSQKTGRLPLNPVTSEPSGDVSVSDEAWWEHVPAWLAGREANVVRSRRFGSNGISERRFLLIDGLGAALPETLLDIAEAIFKQVDGVRTLRDICQGLASGGLAITETRFRQIIHYLSTEQKIFSVVAFPRGAEVQPKG